MHGKDHTKNLLAGALIEMMETTPLEKVRVTMLCKRCDVAPATFYYYFHDKYDLVSWIYLQDIIGASEDESPGFDPNHLDEANARMSNRKRFYQRAFTDLSQNSLREFMYAFLIEKAKESVRCAFGAEMTDRQLLELSYHVYGIVGLFRDWVSNRIPDSDFARMNRLIVDRTPEFLKEALSRSPISTDTLLQMQEKESHKPCP